MAFTVLLHAFIMCILDLRIVESVEIRWKGGQIQWLEILGCKRMENSTKDDTANNSD